MHTKFSPDYEYFIKNRLIIDCLKSIILSYVIISFTFFIRSLKTIQFLKHYEEKMDTAMIYITDHGESFGENGLYLHGLPYFMAPEHQKHVDALMWFGKDYPINTEKLRRKSLNEYSQDNLFSTLLGLFNVQTNIYEKEMDILVQ